MRLWNRAIKTDKGKKYLVLTMRPIPVVIYFLYGYAMWKYIISLGATETYVSTILSVIYIIWSMKIVVDALPIIKASLKNKKVRGKKVGSIYGIFKNKPEIWIEK